MLSTCIITAKIEDIEVEELECLALKEAVSWAISKNLSGIFFESDNETLIKSVNEHTFYVNWKNQGLILDIMFLLNKISQWKCISAKGVSNGVTDK